MTQDWPDWQPHPHQAAAIYTQRVPLARNITTLGSGTLQTLAANSSQQVLTTQPIDQPAVQGLLSAELPLAALGTPFAQLQVVWFDSATNDLVATRKYAIGAGNGVPNIATLLGTARGDIVNVDIINLHATQPLTYDWAFRGVSHVPNDDEWHQDNPNTVSGFTLPGGDPTIGVLAVTAPTVAVGTPALRMTAASSHRVKICIDNSAQPNSCDVLISDPAPSVSLYGSTAGATFWRSGSISAGGVLNGEYQMPNGPVLITITNLGASGSTAPKVTITEMQFA